MSITQEKMKEIVDKYKTVAIEEDLYRERLAEEIRKLNTLWSESLNRNIYKAIYVEEYGDYRDFVDETAKALRKS
jgi:rubrerythrin